jgi:NAD(P)-dependent dehydrogenase (short-subunit alcohol dehydrogenase family)
MGLGLDGKSVLVVGGARGIGRATALAFAAEGAKVAVADINPEGAKETAGLVAEQGAEALHFECDVTRRDSCEQLVEDVVKGLGRLDVLANVVGWSDTTYFVDEDEGYWDRIIEINLKGPIYLCRAALGPMIEQNEGAIVLTSSDAGKVGTKGETVYAAAKAGVIGFVKSLAREVSRHNVRVNAIAPGPTDTPLLWEQADQSIIDRMIRSVPMKRVGKPEEQANAIVFLASDRASYVTGQTLSVSGGLTMSS